MATKPLAPDLFRAELDRRLIDTFDLMLALGLRNKTAIWKRVERGALPQPCLSRANHVAFWDRDAIPELQPDRTGG